MQNNTLSRPGFSLSGTALKRIACLSMLIDHIGAALLENGLFRQNAVWQGSVRLDFVMRMAGRLAFPIYCFLLVEGFVHTHDFRKYALRMLGFALLSEFPFDWAFFSGVWWGHQNVYFTLLLGLLAMKALDTFRTGEGTPDARGMRCAAGRTKEKTAAGRPGHPLRGSLRRGGGAAPLRLRRDGDGPHPRPLSDAERPDGPVHRGRSLHPLRAGGPAGLRAGVVL